MPRYFLVAFAANGLWRLVFRLRLTFFLPVKVCHFPLGNPCMLSAKSVRTLYSRPSIFLKGGYRTVRKRGLFADLVRTILPVRNWLFFLGSSISPAFEKLPSDLSCFREQLQAGIVREPISTSASSTFHQVTLCSRNRAKQVPNYPRRKKRIVFRNDRDDSQLFGRSK